MPAPFVVTEVYEVAPGFGPTFHRWGTEMLAEMAWADSFLGGRVLESGRTGEGRLLHRWADPAVARLWERSQTRARWLADAAPFARPVPVPERRPVTLPATPVHPPRPSGPPSEAPPGPPPVPPKWKTAVVTLTAVFPPVLFFNLTLIPRLVQVNVVLRTLVLCVGVTAVVTWVMMPRLMPLFRPWLQRPRRARAGHPVRATATRSAPRAGQLPLRPIAAIGASPSAELLIPAATHPSEVRHREPRPSRGHARYLHQAPPDRRDRR